MRRRLVLAVAACGLAARAASAQPAPPAPDRQDAAALMASGVKLFSNKDYLGALAVFRDAYARYPSTKILLNIATTLARLDRAAEAANTYQRYLDAPDAAPDKRAGVSKELEDLDARLGIVTASVTPADAELQIGGGEWLPLARVTHYRVEPGEVAISARRTGYVTASRAVHVDQGAEVAVQLALVARPVAVAVVAPPVSPRRPALAEAPRARLGAIALGHVAVEHPGVAALVGLTAEPLPWLEVRAAALIGKSSGAYAAVALEPLRGRARPYVLAGVPLFFSGGAHVSLRAALGVELAVSRRISILAELAGERALDPDPGIERWTLVPAAGVTARW